MNTTSDAIAYLKKKRFSYWVVKASNGKTKGEYEGDNMEESAAEFSDLMDNLVTGKYELTVRNSKSNYRGALTYDFEVFGGQQSLKPSNNMDASLMAVLIDIRTGLAKIEMKIEANEKETERKFRDLAKALADVFDEKEDSTKQPSPLELLKGVKGLQDDFSGLKV